MPQEKNKRRGVVLREETHRQLRILKVTHPDSTYDELILAALEGYYGRD